MNRSIADIENLFGSITPSPEGAARLKRVRNQFVDLAIMLNDELADGHYKDLAFVNLEISAMQVAKSITRQPIDLT